MENDTQQYIKWFRHSSPYINAHRGKTFVILISGEAVDHANFNNIIHDIALLSSLGVRLVLVHGARVQIEAQLKNDNLQCEFANNLRITDTVSLQSVIHAVGGVRSKIEAMLSMGVANSPMHGAKIKVSSGNYIAAKPLGVIDGIDYQHTGEVRSVNPEAINNLLDAQHLVLVSNLAYSPTGETFNLSVESVAAETAVALKAEKLICFGAAEGCLDEQGKLLRELSTSEKEKTSEDEQARLKQASVNACLRGIKRSHIISYKTDGALIQELFTVNGSGTLISEDASETLRQAQVEDVGGIIELISPLEDEGILVKRSREILENEIEKFSVIEKDGLIIACAALYAYSDEKLGELACISVHPDYRDGKRGDQLLAFIEKQASFQGIEQLFVLTTQTAQWFQERNFQSGSTDILPKAKKTLYNMQRNSKIFIKQLTGK